ncbi:MAG: hypothetical protein LBT62_02870 [Deltaproteobacteria bacterium]|jgi:intracellular multiplication protein IcmB|nr:hypothetical protein [Deltaproteobacteria bacterium]
MSLFSAFNRASLNLFHLLKGPASSFCRLETSDDQWTLAADDGSLISALSVHGSLVFVSDEDFERLIAIVAEKTRVLLEKPGHFISMVFDYDPLGASSEIAQNLLPAQVTAGECRLALNGVLEDWEKILSQHCGSETFTVSLWTTPSLLPELERRKAIKQTCATLSRPVRDRQTEGRAIAALRHAHYGARQALLGAMTSAGLSASILSAHEILRSIRLGLDPHLTPSDWQAVLPGDPRPLMFPERDQDARHSLMLPSLAGQLFPTEALVMGRDLVKIGQRLHAPFYMSLPPRNPRPFSELFRVLSRNNPKDPLRISINLSPDGFDGMGLKGTLARILSFTSSDNRSLAASLAQLKALADCGETIVGLSMAFDTWLDGADLQSEQAQATLRARLSRLARQVSGWGQAQVQEATGDPLLGVCATLPAMMPHGGPAPRAAAPLSAAWSFLPVRPSSPWRAGPLALRTPDGKIMPFCPNSSIQSAWIDLGVAPMGGGKSLLLNTINLIFCLQAGLRELPWVSIIDVGPSSKGLVSLLRAALPEELRHLAVHHRLRMDPKEAINPFDTPLGVREPISSHLTFLVNLICLMATPLDAAGPPSGVEGVIRLAVVAAYRSLSDRPRPLDVSQEPELCDLAFRLGFSADSHSSWWELVDFFFEKGMPHQALLAQRRAVPLLGDVVAQVRQHPGLKKTYNFNVQGASEAILDYVWRELTQALGRYRFLAAPTRLSFGDARVIALDLDEAAPRGAGAVGDRQTAIMYMLARQLCGGKFFLTPSDLPDIPERYRPYHGALIRDIRKSPKRLCYDELHRVTGQSAVRNQLVRDLETTARESRKWNLSIGLYSQSFEDFPQVLLELATSIFLLGSGTKRGRDQLSTLFGLNSALQAALDRLGKPTAAGADLVALFRTAQGTTQQLLTNTVPPTLLWAFSTTSEDISVRDALYDSYGVEATLRILSKHYPSGIKAEVERRKAARSLSERHHRVMDVIDELIHELSKIIENAVM